jgi:hypothetical protein
LLKVNASFFKFINHIASSINCRDRDGLMLGFGAGSSHSPNPFVQALWRRTLGASGIRNYILDEGGSVMSRRTSKIILALILAFAAPTASACTFPVTIQCGPGLTCVP